MEILPSIHPDKISSVLARKAIDLEALAVRVKALDGATDKAAVDDADEIFDELKELIADLTEEMYHLGGAREGLRAKLYPPGRQKGKAKARSKNKKE